MPLAAAARVPSPDHLTITPRGAAAPAPILDIRDLTTTFATPRGAIRPVDAVSLSVPAGRTLGIVGESGCGKSMLSLSLMGLVPAPGRFDRGLDPVSRGASSSGWRRASSGPCAATASP